MMVNVLIFDLRYFTQCKCSHQHRSGFRSTIIRFATTYAASVHALYINKSMNISPAAKSTSPAIPRNQTQQTQQSEQSKPQSRPRSRQASLPIAAREQTYKTQLKSPSRPASPPLAERERKEFVDYATRSSLKLDSLSPQDMHTVKVGTKAMGDTREKLPLRGNVMQDLKPSGDRSAHRLMVARGTAGKVPTKEFLSTTNLAHCMVMGAGNCGEFSALTARNVVGNLSPGETACKVALTSTKSDGSEVDHVIVKIKPRQESGNSEVCADAWANGSAVRTRDASFTMQGPVENGELFSPEEGPKLLADLDAYVNAVSANSKKAMTREVEKRAGKVPFVKDDPGMFYEIQSTSRQFEEHSRAAAMSVKEVQGPREKNKAVVVGAINYDSATSVNNMVKQLAKELDISEEDAAEQVANAVSNAALEPQRYKDDAWLTIPPRLEMARKP